MRVLIIDPARRTTTSLDLGKSSGIFGLLGRHKVSGRLPNKDYVLCSRGATDDEGFSVGGSAVVAGLGVVVGKIADPQLTPRSRSSHANAVCMPIAS